MPNPWIRPDLRIAFAFNATICTILCLAMATAPSYAADIREHQIAPSRTHERLPVEALTLGPFGNVAVFGFNTWYVRVPDHAAFDLTSGFTIEAWVKVDADTGGCPTIVGKGYLTTWWIGVCSNEIRSYINGFSFDSGTLSTLVWHHVALTWDGATRRHYIDGELTGEEGTPGPLATNSSEVRIGKDVHWSIQQLMAIDEVRVWNRPLNEWEINQRKRLAIREQEPGLVSVWSFDNVLECATFTRDDAGPHDGEGVDTPCIFDHSGNSVITVPALPSATWLTTSELPGFRFQVRITSGGIERVGTKVNDCVPETLCVAGAIPSRSELFLRIIGPRPNGMMWAQGPRFTISQVEVWIQELATGELNYYVMDAVPSEEGEIPGFNDRFAFFPD